MMNLAHSLPDGRRNRSEARQPTDLADERSFSTHPKQRIPLTPTRLGRLAEIETEMTTKLTSSLEQAGARVAILSRAGSDLSSQRFLGEVPRYTHSGFAYRGHAGWSVLHVLNTHAGARGDLCRQPLIDFTRDDPWKYRFEIMTLVPDIEESVLASIATALPMAIHRPEYSAIAHPRSRRYQQSNQWLIEFLGACLFDADGLDRPEERRSWIQEQLHAHGLRPSVIRKRALAGFAGQWAYQAWARNLRFDDHPLGARSVGDFAFISSKTVHDLLLDNGWLRSHREVFAGASIGAFRDDARLIGVADV